MFSKISLNVDEQKGKKHNVFSQRNKMHFHKMGIDEGNIDYKSTHKRDYSLKPVIIKFKYIKLICSVR